jgi:hypothetical protein
VEVDLAIAHLLVAWTIAAGAAAVLVAALWSWLEARLSGDRQDHRFAVDRVLVATVVVALGNVVIGSLLYATGTPPKDPLHLLYGVAAVATLPLGWWFGGRPARTGRSSRRRRDGWVAVAAVALLGVTLRLFMTG